MNVTEDPSPLEHDDSAIAPHANDGDQSSSSLTLDNDKAAFQATVEDCTEDDTPGPEAIKSHTEPEAPQISHTEPEAPQSPNPPQVVAEVDETSAAAPPQTAPASSPATASSPAPTPAQAPAPAPAPASAPAPGTARSPKTARAPPPERIRTNERDNLPAFIQTGGNPPLQSQQPEAFRYLDADSPPVTRESIQRTISNGNTNSFHPVSPAHSYSSIPSSHISDVFSNATRRTESHGSLSPEQVPTQHSPAFRTLSAQQSRHLPNHNGFHEFSHIPQGAPQQTQAWTGSPEMTYGNISSPPFPGHAAPNMQGSQFSPQMGPSVPMPHKPTIITGYQHVALKLAGGVPGYPQVIPIYRRFEALNHRLLLQLQDEISELEQQLSFIDDRDTEIRAVPHGFLPASRRDESLGQGEIGSQKKDLFSNLAFKLDQYNKLISSFKQTQDLQRPEYREVEDYRIFLDHEKAIVAQETTFLNDPNDLISLAPEWDEPPLPAGTTRTADATPTPPSSSIFHPPPAPATAASVTSKARTAGAADRFQRRPGPGFQSPMYLVHASMIAMLVPLLTFLVVPGFVERMIIVGVVLSAVVVAVMQSGLATLLSNRLLDCVICIGLYGGFMIVVASAFA